MAGIKITDLPTSNTLDGTEQLPIVQNAITKVATVDDITSDLASCTDHNSLVTYVQNLDSATDSCATETIETHVRATSACYVVTSNDNTFSGTQTFDALSAQSVTVGTSNFAHSPGGIATGEDNLVTGSCSASIGGYVNQVFSNGSGILGGNNNTIDTNAHFSAIIGGGSNDHGVGAGPNSVIIGGCCNKVFANDSVVIGGQRNEVETGHAHAVVLGGTCTSSVSSEMVHMTQLQVRSLPTSDPNVAGVIYRDNGNVKVSTNDVVVSDTAGTASTYSSSDLFFSSDHVTYGPAAAAVSGSYYKPNAYLEDELTVTFYSDADTIELKIERSNSLIQVFIDDEPVHEYASGGYQNRLLKLTHTTPKIRKYELRGKNYGFGGVYTNTAVNTYSVWPYESRRERPLLLVATDSYGNAFNDVYGLSFAHKLANFLDMDLHLDAVDSSGWSSTGSAQASTRAASLLTLTRNPDVILGCLGYNDKSSPNQTNIETGINDWHNTFSAVYTSAEIMLCSPWTPVGAESGLTTVSGYIAGRATALGADFIDINGAVTSDSSSLYTSDDSTHPNQAGHEYLARRIEALMLRTGNVPSSN